MLEKPVAQYNGGISMLYPQIDPEKWAAIYDLELEPATCLKCKCQQKFTIPFAYKEFRGLISNHLECGEEFRRSIFTTVDKSEGDDLGKFVTSFWAASVGL